MALLDQYTESTAIDLRARIQAAMCMIAQNVATEDTATAGHSNRAMLAQQVSRGPSSLVDPFSSMLTAQGITRQSTDQDIQNMISSVWNTMAGTTI